MPIKGITENITLDRAKLSKIEVNNTYGQP